MIERGEMPEADDAAEISKLAYAEGQRALTSQAETLERIRTRASALLSLATAVVVFAAGALFSRQPRFGCLDWVLAGHAAFAYVLLLAMAVDVQRPRKDWRFAFSPKVIIEGYADDGASLTETHRTLALVFGENFEHNQEKLNTLNRRLSIGFVLLVLGVTLWVTLAAVAR